MSEGGGVARPALFRIKTVRGEPTSVEGRRLIPVVRIISFGKARATVGARRMSAWGGGFVWIRPLAVLEETPEGQRRIAVTDATAVAVRALLGLAVAISLALTATRWLVQRSRRASVAC
jgi:uncharacterized spore protein YtfJ